MSWYNEPTEPFGAGLAVSVFGAAGIVFGARGLVLFAIGVRRPDAHPFACVLVLAAGPLLLMLGIRMVRGTARLESLFTPTALFLSAVLCAFAAGWVAWANTVLGVPPSRWLAVVAGIAALGCGALLLGRRRLKQKRQGQANNDA